MAQFLVTGGSGFIGSHLCRKLLGEGHGVRVLDNLSSGKRANLSDVAGDIDFHEADLRDEDAVQRAVKGVEYILHHAAVASVQTSVEEPLIEQQINSVGTLNLLEAARQAGVRRVVFAASAAAYGNDPRVPKREDMRPTPESPYAISKLAGEYYCGVYDRLYGLETVCLRYFNVYGPRQDPASPYSGVISIFAKRMLNGLVPLVHGDGLQTRDFVSVYDVVAANMLAHQVESARGQVYNIGSGRRSSLMDLLTALNAVLSSDIQAEFVEARAGDVRDSLADISKAQSELGYRPSMDLQRGLREVIEWMRAE
jgi:UDP-glucose 4-epimerase